MEKLELENGFSPFPDFFEIYNSSENVSQRVIIPIDYIKYYSKPLPKTAVLKKPEGNFWTVKWTLSQDGTLSFQDGWSKFVTDNEIIERDLLLFTYDGSRSFWIRIYRNNLPVNPTAPVAIQEISDDDEDETTGNSVEDSHANMIVSLSLGSSDDDFDYNDDDDEEEDEDYYETTVCEASHGRSIRAGKKNAACVNDPETYLDNPTNPFFISISSCPRRVLVISQQAIKDYALNFGRTVNIIDGLGEVTKKVGEWKDRVVVNSWDKITKRNNAKSGDIFICEIFRESNEGVVKSIKVHLIRK